MSGAADLRRRALGFLARREHTRLELERKLAPHAGSDDDIAGVLDDFERRGWLSERRTVEQVIDARRSRFGSRRISAELRSKGVSDGQVEQAAERLKHGDLDAARAVWGKKFGTPPRNPRERARQVRFLQGRGFALETALQVVGGAGGDENRDN